MYYSLVEAAERMDVKRDWLRRMVQQGYLPKRRVGHTFVVDDADIELARGLQQSMPDKPQYAKRKQQEVGYTVQEFANMADVRGQQVIEWARDAQIDCQSLGRTWIIFPSALLQVKELKQSLNVSTERKEDVEYRTKTGNPQKIPALDEVYKVIVALRLEGKNFAEIGRDERVNKSRERTNKIFATVLRRVALLQQRGIVDVADIARNLDIDVGTTDKLIEQVNNANK